MSDKKKSLTIRTTDIEGKDLEKLEKYIGDGTPGIGNLTKEQIAKMYQLYVTGKNYNQISSIMRVEKPAIMFISRKLQWFEDKQEYSLTLNSEMRDRVMQAELQAADLMTNTIDILQRKINGQINKFHETGKEEDSRISLKELETFLKTVKALKELVAEPRQGGAQVNVNIGANATMSRGENGAIEVTAKEPVSDDDSNELERLANEEREKDKKK